MPLPDFKAFSEKTGELKALVKILPRTVPLGTKRDRIYQVFDNIPVPNDVGQHWETFNRRMDNLFGEELRDAAGRLLNVKRGPFGMDMVTKYFDEACQAGNLMWDLVLIKVDRLVVELKFLTYVQYT
jgi:hypothetical protein